MLDCKIRVGAEVSQSTPPATPTNLARLKDPAVVINPTGTQLGWARWQSSARDAIEPVPRYVFGTVPSIPTVLTVGGDLLKELGWANLLKELVRSKGCLEEALFLLRENIAREIERSPEPNIELLDK